VTDSTRAWLQMHFCVFLVGFTAILGKTITLPALPLVWLRLIVVTAALLLFPGFWRGLSGMSLSLMATYAGIGVVVTCMALSPVFVAFVEPALVRRRFNLREVFFGIAAIPGMALVVGGTPSGMRFGIAVGILSAFLAAVFFALNKRFIHKGTALTVTGLEMAAGAICLSFVSPFVLPSRHDAILLVILAIACTLLPFWLSLVALRHLSAFSGALALNMEPVYSIVLAIVLLGEQRELTVAFYVGVVLTMAVVFGHGRFERAAIQ
jgi:drug/metabolite transporter (DMT)-like permease